MTSDGGRIKNEDCIICGETTMKIEAQSISSCNSNDQNICSVGIRKINYTNIYHVLSEVLQFKNYWK